MTGKRLKDYLSLLIALQNNPFGTTDELSDESDISKPTVIKRLRVLQGAEPIVPETSPKKYFTVEPILDYSTLGLEPVDILAETKTLDGVKALEQIALAHPYTVYRSRCFGSPNGILLQFRTPLDTRKKIEELFESLWDRDILLNYQILPTNNSIVRYTSMQLKGWDANDARWEFDWKTWFNSPTKKTLEPLPESEPGKSLEWMTKNDLHIIRELMIDTRRKNTEIIDELESRGISFTPQTFGRHLQIIKDECIRGYRVVIAPEPFDVLNNILVIGKSEQSHLEKLVAKTQFRDFPFESTIRIADENLFWFVRLNQHHISPFLNGLFDTLKETKICFLDYEHSYLYNIWPDAFDEDKKEWRADDAFLLDRVLSSLKNLH